MQVISILTFLQDSKYMLDNFGLCAGLSPFPNELQGSSSSDTTHVYICIPWKNFDDHRWPRTTTQKPLTTDIEVCNDEEYCRPYLRSMAKECVVDQDLSITRQKTLIINKMIRDLDLVVWRP